jgi:hypothetical protein
MKHNKGICLMVAAAFLLLMAGAPALMAQAKADAGSAALLLKPDIVVDSVAIARTGFGPAGEHLVTITVVVKNKMVNTATGAFKVKVEWTENPTSGWTYLQEGGVDNLGSSSPARAAVVYAKTLTFTHSVPLNKAYKYRVTADHMNVVSEGNETNNVAAAGYIAR